MRLDRLALFLAATLTALPRCVDAAPRLWTPTDVFVGGVGYPNYRSPAITAAPNGTLIAIAEGRTFDDPGIGNSDLDIVVRRSTDGGATWSPMQVVDSWAGGASSNPTTVRDNTTGRLFLLYNRWEGTLGTTNSLPGTNNNTTWMRYSDDDGATWSNASNITSNVKDYNNWNTVSFGPGSGIQASNGRLIIPSARWVNGWAGYAVYSTDHGATWVRGSLTPGGNLSGENQLVQLADGRILMDARPNIIGNPRANFTSTNGGITWSAMTTGQTVPDVEAAIERYTLASAGADRNRILFTAPRGPDRQDLVIRTSYDETLSYINERLLYDGYSGYSDLTVLPDKSIGVFFETNEARSLTFLRLNREYIEPPRGLSAFDGFRYNSSAVGTKNGGLLWNAGWTGAVNLTGAPTARIENSDLAYTNFPFPVDGQRRVYSPAGSGGVMARSLANTIDLATKQTTYLSLLIRQDNLGFDFENSAEALDISLLAGTVKQIGFGIRGNESLYYDLPGQSGNTVADTLTKNDVYYLCVKIQSDDASSAGNRDRIYLRLFRSGDAVPEVDDSLGWTLAGISGSNSAAAIDRIFIRGGIGADWLLDELRIGKTFGSVVSNVLQYRWTQAAGGDWNTVDNWEDDAPTAGQVAKFGAAISQPSTITLGGTRTVGGIAFANSNAYTLAGAANQKLIVDATSGDTSISSSLGEHVIQVPVELRRSTNLTIAAASRLTFVGGITADAGTTFTLNGAGVADITTLQADALNVASGTLRLLPGGGTSTVQSITLGGSFDLTDNRLVINFSGSTAVEQVEAWVASGRNGGDWLGAGLTSSLAAGSGALSLGVAPDVGGVAVRLTLLGDADLNRSVDFADLLVLAQHYGEATAATWAGGDFNYDNAVDFADLLALAQSYGQPYLQAANASGGTVLSENFTADWQLAQSLVPEPVALSALLAMTFFRRPLRRTVTPV